MPTPDYNLENSFQFNIRDRCNETGRDWGTNIRKQFLDLKMNEECLKTELDLQEELRDKARIRELS